MAMNLELKDDFAIAIDNTMKAFSHDKTAMKKHVVKLVDETLNHMNINNRDTMIKGKDIGDQHFLIKNLDGIFELVKEYLIEDLTYFCTRAYFSAVHKFALKHCAEIEDRAMAQLNHFLDTKDEYLNQYLDIQDELKKNNEYKELRRLQDKVEYSEAVKKLIETKIRNFEAPLTSLSDSIEGVNRKLCYHCIGNECKGENVLPISVINFLNVQYPAIRKQKEEVKII